MRHSTRSNPKLPSTLEFEALGVPWRIDWAGTPTPKVLAPLVQALLDDFDRNYSRFRSDSLVREVAEQAGDYELPASAASMLGLYRALYELSDGRFTPLIGQLVADAGYDANYTLKPRAALASPPSWEAVMHYDPPVLHTQAPILLDFGAAGKGYAVDLVAELLVSQGIEAYLIDASGDLLCQVPTGQALTVGLEDPADSSRVIGTARLQKGSLCGSAGNRRAWGEFTHLIDPVRRQSPRHLAATWVVAETALVADALATCLFFVDPAVLAGHFSFEYCMVNANRSVRTLPNFPGELFVEAV